MTTDSARLKVSRTSLNSRKETYCSYRPLLATEGTVGREMVVIWSIEVRIKTLTLLLLIFFLYHGIKQYYHRSLDLSFNGIRHIKNMDHLVKLTDLFFVSNKITLIENLSTLVNLTNLELGSNRIRVKSHSFGSIMV
jgi:hypothetical protein